MLLERGEGGLMVMTFLIVVGMILISGFFTKESDGEFKAEENGPRWFCFIVTTILLLGPISGMGDAIRSHESMPGGDIACALVLIGVGLIISSVLFFSGRPDEELRERSKWAWRIIFSMTTALILMLIFALGSSWFYDMSKKSERETYENSPKGQIEKVDEMHTMLDKQISTIKTTQSKYSSTINDLSSEIRREKDRSKIVSLDQASERMKYNIQLIQEMDAYQAELVKHLRVTESGLEEVVYMQRRLDAKKLMSEVIGDSKTLGQGVDTLIKKYSPLMNQYVIDPKKLTIKSPEEIWKQIEGGKE